jgi:hypothetical protein
LADKPFLGPPFPGNGFPILPEKPGFFWDADKWIFPYGFGRKSILTENPNPVFPWIGEIPFPVIRWVDYFPSQR